MRRASAPRRPLEWLGFHRVRVGLPVGALCIVLARPTAHSMAFGAGVGVVGLLIRGAAAGHLSKHATLTDAGPYAVMRHPLYFGSVFVAAGLLVAANSWASAIFAAAYLSIFYPLAIRHEEERLERRYGQAFEAYAARVSSFWPRSIREGVSSWRFSWALYRYNGEFQSTLGVLAALAVLWLRMHASVIGL
jgi:protein-S-isoprenylcysteine O-methyltransferase Ste14